MKMIAPPTAKNLKAIADYQYELTNTIKKDILEKMVASAENGYYSYTISFSDRKKYLIPKIKDWLENLGYKCYINDECIISISWEV